jgi:hypothetical protein
LAVDARRCLWARFFSTSRGHDSAFWENSGVPAKPDLIVFLCPNGHRLNGPASLEGKPGQCPHCGVKFRVPSRHDVEEEPPKPEPVEPKTDSEIENVEAIEEVPDAEPSFNFDFENQAARGSSPSHETVPPPGAPPDHNALAEMFVRLWEEQDRGTVLELHLNSGATLVPERFSRELSTYQCGVFAHRDADGTYTVTALDWKAISRICLRHLSNLPRQMFD